MKNSRNRIKKTAISSIICLSLIMSLFVSAPAVHADNDGVKPTKISRVGKKTRTVYVGKEFELKVRTNPKDADDDYLKWTITSGKKYVKYAEKDRTDDEMEFKAKKAGTAKITCKIKGTKTKVTFTVKVKKAPKVSKKIKAKGKTSRTVELGDDFELEVKKYSGLRDNDLKWSIADSKIVKFEGRDRTDNDMDFIARRLGSTKITCTNQKTKQKITFNIKVVPDQDDDYDDDDDDDDD